MSLSYWIKLLIYLPENVFRLLFEVAFITKPNEVLKLLHEVEMIRGIYGDEAHLFSPEQWVNVYVNQCDRAIYYSTTQVKYLERQPDYDLEDFLLEPTTEDGELMTVAEAKQCCQ